VFLLADALEYNRASRLIRIISFVNSCRRSLDADDFLALKGDAWRRLRIPVVVHDCTRECLALVADHSISYRFHS
jgi:hypothetical protein